jgi:stage II sporulation protein M
MEDKKCEKNIPECLIKRFFYPDREYLRSLIPYIALAALLFTIGILSGYYVSEISPENTRELVSLLRENYEPMLSADKTSQILFIFLKNSVASFSMIITGLIFGIFPVIGLIGNGEILGMLSNIFLEDNSVQSLLAGIMPHGIIEIPFFLMSSAMGLKIGKTTFNKIFRKLKKKKIVEEEDVKKEVSIKKEMTLALSTFLKIVLIFLFIAAVIEVLATPEIFRIF